MKDFKRRLAIVLAACMVLTNVMQAFAEETAEIPAVGNEIVQEEITETELDVATPEEALYEDAEIENDDIEEITPSDGDIEEASPSEAYAFIREAVVDGVRITLTADAGVFPENAELYAVKIEDDETKEAIDEAVEKEKGEEDADKNVAFDLKFDIKMLADGEEIQPDTSKGSVKVTFALEDVVNDCLDINVYHVKEDAEENLVAETLEVEVEKTGSVSEEEIAEADTEDSEIVEGTLISAETDGFSYYVVEFTYNGLTYELPGSGRVQLSEILAYVGIVESAEDAKGKVTKVEISNTDLFSAEKDGDDWTITSHQSFTSEEWMKVEFDGLEYEIIVTDPAPPVPVTVKNYQELKEAVSAADDGVETTITLANSINDMTSFLSIPENKNIILDLNNCTLDRGLKEATASQDGNAIRVGKGVSLTIKNGTITGSHPINNGGKGALRCNETKELNLINVKFDECKNVALFIIGVNSTNIKGCTFSGNTYGGAMVGGAAIDVGKSDTSGKKIEVMIENCSFENNVITGGSGSAIHLFLEYGDCDMTIKDSTFTGNHAGSVESNDDGGVICAYTGSLILDGCTITGNTAAAEPKNNHCGGVSVSKDVKSFIIKGKTIIADNTCGGEPADLCLQNEGAIFKVEDLKPESNIGVMTVYDIEKGASAVIGENAKVADLQYFFADNPDYSLKCEDGKLKLTNGAKKPDPIETWAGLQAAITAAKTTPTTITLTRSLTAESTDTALKIADGQNITLDLNTCTLDRGLDGKEATEEGNVIKVGEGATLTVMNGTITGSNPSSAAGALLCQSSTDGSKPGPKGLNLTNVKFTDCKGGALSLYDVKNANIESCIFIGNTNEKSNGGAININAMNMSDTKKVTVKDCLFENNKVTNGSGSAICIFGRKVNDVPYADVTIINSEFTGNIAGEGSGEGGAICAYRINGLVLDGCTITGNTSLAKDGCGGLSIGGWADKLTIKGKTIISGNTCLGKPADLCLQKEGAIFKVEGLKPESKIGVMTVYDIEKGASAVIGENAKDADLQYFFADNPDYSLKCEDGKLILSNDLIEQHLIVTFIYRNGKENTIKDVLYNEKVSKPLDPKMEGYTFDAWCSDAECKIEYNFSTPVIDNLPLYARWKKDAGTEGNVRTENKVVEIIVHTEKPEEKELLKDLEKNTSGSVESANSLADAVKNKVKEEATKNGKDVILFIDTQLTGIKVEKEQTGETEKATTTLTYDATPWMSTIGSDGKVEETRKIDNNDLNGNITLRLPVPASITEKYVNIVHESDGYPKKTYKNLEIVNQGTDKAYVEIKISHFSSFELTFSNEKSIDPVPYNGNSGSGSTSELFTGRPGNPVSNGKWTLDANGIWHYATTASFRNTWGYIKNPYAKPGQHEADWFYFDNAGNMLIGWQLIGGKWYYLNPFQDGTGTLGACLIGPGKTPDGYEIDDQGAWTGR